MLTTNDFIDGFTVVDTNGVSNTYSQGVAVEYGDGLLIMEGAIVVANVDNYDNGFATYPKKGIYFLVTERFACVTSLTINGYKGFETTEITPIPEKYLPSGGGAFVVGLNSENNTVITPYDEILKAILNGSVIMFIDGIMNVYYLNHFSLNDNGELNGATFVSIKPFNSNINVIDLSYDGTWSVTVFECSMTLGGK